MSDTWVGNIGPNKRLKADFGSGKWDGAKIGIPYTVVPSTQPTVPINYIWYGDQSDAGPFPIPKTAPIEGGGDRHVLVIQKDKCILYELYAASKVRKGRSWKAGSGAKWNLTSNNFRPLDWTSADAAGLPIFPGLVRYDEIVAGEIRHAIRFTVPTTTKRYDWPATHWASSVNDDNYPPMGARFRLKDEFNISGFSETIQIILRALKKYGLVLADNGSAWYMSGVPDERWDNDMLNEEFVTVLGQHFEAVDVSSLMQSSTSGATGRTRSPTPPTVATSQPSLSPTNKPTRYPTKRRRHGL